MFIEKITRERQIILSFDEIYELEKIRDHQPVTEIEYKKKFLDIGIIERVGKTSGAKYILSHKYYTHEGKIGEHTRLRGISREKCKTLILEHLKKNKGYLHDLCVIFPELKRMDISNLLQELKTDDEIEHVGSKRKGYWKLKN